MEIIGSRLSPKSKETKNTNERQKIVNNTECVMTGLVVIDGVVGIV